MTLARKRTEMRLKEEHSIAVKGVFGKMNVYESLLTKQGAKYTVLKSFPLEAGYDA
jgi:2'-5' RNA ligase